MKKIIFPTFCTFPMTHREVKFVPPRFKLDLQFFNDEDDSIEELKKARQTIGLPLEEPINISEVEKAYKKQSLKHLSDKNNNSEESKKEFQKILIAKEILIKAIEKEEWKKKPETVELISKNKDLESNLTKAAQWGLFLNEENERLVKKVDELEINLANKERETIDLDYELKKAEGWKHKEKELNSAIKQLEEEKEEAGSKIQELKTEVSKLNVKNQEEKQQNQNFKQDQDVSQQRIKEKQEEVKKWEKWFSGAKKIIEELQAEQEIWKKIEKENTDIIENLHNELEHEKEQWSRKITKALENPNNFLQAIAELTQGKEIKWISEIISEVAEADRRREESENLTNLVEVLRARIERSSFEKEQLENELADKYNDSSLLEESYLETSGRSLGEELSTSKNSSSEEIKKEISRKKQQLTKLKDKYRAKNSQIQQLGKKFAQVQKKLALAEIKFNNSQTNASQLNKNLDKKGKKIQALQKQNSFLNNQLKQVKDRQIQQTMEQQQTIQCLQVQLESAKEQLAKIKVENKENYRALEAERQAHREIILEQKKQKDERQKEKVDQEQQMDLIVRVANLKINLLNGDIKSLKNKFTKLTKKNNKLSATYQQERTNYQHQQTKYRDEIAELKQALQEKSVSLSKSEKINASLQQRLNWTKQQAEEKELRSQKLIKQLEYKMEDLETELYQEKSKNITLTSANKNFQAKNKILKEDLEIARERKKELIDKLHTLRIQQKKDAEKAKQNNVHQSLVKWENIPKNNQITQNEKLEKSITETNNAFIDTIATTQQHLGVKDLTQLTTSHPIPKGKNLRNLIDFYLENKDKFPIPPAPIRTDTPFGEELMVIKQLDLNSLTNLLGSAVDSTIQKQIQEATNYSQIVQIRQNFLTNYLTLQSSSTENNLDSINTNNFWQLERFFWITLLISSLLTIGGLLVKIKRARKKLS